MVPSSAGFDFAAVGQVSGVPTNSTSVSSIAIQDTSGSANVVTFWDNTSGAGHMIAAFTLAAGGGATVTDLDVTISKGVFIVATGAVKGTVWVA